MKDVLQKVFIGVLLSLATMGMMKTAVSSLDTPVAFVNELRACERAEVVENGELVKKSPCPSGWESYRQIPILSKESQNRIESGLIEQPSYDMGEGIQLVKHPR